MKSWNLTADEAAFGVRIQRHFLTWIRALFVALALSAIVLVSGKYLAKYVDVSPQSILFGLWPFNHVYLRQFSDSRYGQSDIEWFFTVVSCSNIIWIIFLGWKIVAECIRADVRFPRGRTPVIYQMIVRGLAVGIVFLALASFVGFSGFNLVADTPFGPSFRQSIAVGAVKIILSMSAIYFMASVVLEFAGLAIRYLLAKKFGYFSAAAPIAGTPEAEVENDVQKEQK